jgi:polysaccharide biosynthesis transport protein
MSVESPRPEDLRMDMGAMLAAVLSRWLGILLVTALVLAVTFTILLFMPRMYESGAALLVEDRSRALARPAGEQAPSQPSIPVEAMMSSQIELIRSRDTLLDVIDSENLRSEPEFAGTAASPIGLVLQLFGRRPEPRSVEQQVLQNLNERLTVIRERDSAVISVLVRSTDPERAARIANAIAQAHVKRRSDLSLADTASASAWLLQEIERLRGRVREAEEAVANYRVDNELFAPTTNGTVPEQQLSAVAAQIIAAQERRNVAESRARLIRGLLQSGQSVDGVADVRDSVVIQQLSQSKANLQSELAQRSSTLLPNHPTIKALVAQVAEVEAQIAVEGRRVADALEAEARIEGDLAESLNADLARMKLSVSSATRDTVTLEGLQREARAQRDLLESYLLQYSDAISRTDVNSALPDVRVITVAAPSVEPASPKVGLVLGAVGFVALALQIGGILFGELMSGRALTDRRTFARVSPEFDEEIDTGEPAAIADLFEMPAADADAAGAPAAENEEGDEALEREALTADREASDDADSPDGEARNGLTELETLSADIGIGRVRVVMLSALASNSDCEEVADSLVMDALRRGLSVVRIDAGSGRRSDEPGLSDLSIDRASFGDVVHKVGDGLAEVPWGRYPVIERRSLRPTTLIEALTDIYEVVVVTTGRIGLASSLPLFTGIECRLVLVGRDRPDVALIGAAVEDAASLGYEVAQVVAPPLPQTKVA